MDTLMKADIFFFVATIAVAVFLVLGGIALWYLIGFLRNVKRASDTLEKEIAELGDQAETLYHRISESFVFNLLFAKKGRAKRGKA